MDMDLTRVDPEWAWSPYEPDASRPWDRHQAAHLYRRAGFAADERQLAQAVQRSPAELVRELVRSQADASFEREMEQLTAATLAGNDPQRLGSVWLYRMLAAPDQVLEKLTLFWHGHFATSAEKVADARLMQQQNDLLRQAARGPFLPLVQAISRDPAMLLYLDSASNRKSHPNENYARELMELFCLGEGNYSERDVLEVARCFTGWQVRRGRFRFNAYHHDDGRKSFLGASGPFDGGDAVEVVVAQPAAARFLTARLVRFLVRDEPDLPDRLLAPLAEFHRRNELHTGQLVERILGSNLFFSPLARGAKIRSPSELAVGLLRALEGTANTVELAEQIGHLGQRLYFPPSVKGWDGGRSWINSSTLLGRANLVQALLRSRTTRFAGGSLRELAARHGREDAERFVDWLAELLLAVPLPEHVRAELVRIADAGGDSPADPLHDAYGKTLHALAALPEFQLG